MLQIQETITIDADPDRVWALAGDPGMIDRWLPALQTCAMAGDLRSCVTVDGAELRERVLERNDAERYYVYEIVESPLPVVAYRSILGAQGHDHRAHVGWAAEFEPAADADSPELERTVRQIYRDGLQSLRFYIEGRA